MSSPHWVPKNRGVALASWQSGAVGKEQGRSKPERESSSPGSTPRRRARAGAFSASCRHGSSAVFHNGEIKQP